jgi:molybdenum cofactor guanylyltransferase
MTPDERTAPTAITLGVILAGGRSRRFGSPKAIAEVGGAPLLQRVRNALAAVPVEIMVAGSDPQIGLRSLPVRPDARPGHGPMGGLATGLAWAVERRAAGILLVACDMPFLSTPLLRRLAEMAAESGARAVAPSGPGGRVQPLCAWYSAELLAPVEQRIDRGALAMGEFLELIGAITIPPDEVARFGDPAALFHNVNTPADHAEARSLSERSGHG